MPTLPRINRRPLHACPSRSSISRCVQPFEIPERRRRSGMCVSAPRSQSCSVDLRCCPRRFAWCARCRQRRGIPRAVFVRALPTLAGAYYCRYLTLVGRQKFPGCTVAPAVGRRTERCAICLCWPPRHRSRVGSGAPFFLSDLGQVRRYAPWYAHLGVPELN